MEVVHPRCAGMDISKTDAKVCVRAQGAGRRKTSTEVTEWAAKTSKVMELADYLLAQKVTCVVMEATGNYWKIFWHLLTGAGLEVVLANAARVRQIPGKKTDIADCVWLADLCAHGLVAASFVPPAPVAQLKDLVRARAKYAKVAGQEAQRLQDVLESAGVKLSCAVTDIMGVSGRRMVEALIAGEGDPLKLARLGERNLKASEEELAEALTGRFSEHHAFLARTHLDTIDHLRGKAAALDARIDAFFDPDCEIPAGGSGAGLSREEREEWRSKRELLQTVPGVSETVAEQILAETGPDMSVFASPKHLASWAGVAPGMNQSAGRAKPTKAKKGDKHLKGALGVAALSVARHPGTFLHSRYRRVCARQGKMKALVAVERSMVVSIWHILSKGEPYRELGADYYLRRRPGAAIRKAVDNLRRLGFEVDVNDGEAPTAVLTPVPLG
ncbi:MAG: IS110 family transposase [Bifidobacteriaceae bacterium]|nr:IS110 family transposase [Bifidobacteriaceae bacterium]